MTITDMIRRDGTRDEAHVAYVQARWGIRQRMIDPTLQISIFKRNYPVAITYIRYLEEIASELSAQAPIIVNIAA